MEQGDLVAGRYRVVRRAGSGGMGAVYEATDIRSNMPVALKTLRLDTSVGARAHLRLLREAQALAEVRHPAVVRYVDHGVTPPHGPYLVMEWVVGRTLEDRLNAGAIGPDESLALIGRLASGLAAVHAAGVVHRDLKPSNVMLADGDVARAVVVDFGVARLASAAITVTGDQVGTPRYMAPEQIRSARTVDDRADVFALGCILYEGLTGHPAFEGEDPVTVLARILFEPMPVPSARRPGLAPSLDALVGRMLDRDPARRPPASALQAIIADAVARLGHAPANPPALRPPAADETVASRRFTPDRTTPWDPYDDLSAPPSFQLGPDDALGAAQRLPSLPGSFIGREPEVQQLLSLLRAGGPLCGVWGGPGVGKTRLAVETLRRAVADGPPRWDALVYADLAEARDAGDVVRVIATAAGVSLEPGPTPEMSLGSALDKLGRAILLIDPVEHVASIAGALTRAFRRTAPRLQVLATSRRKNCPPGASAIELGPLSTASVEGAPSPAAALLLDRAGDGSADRAELVAQALEGNPLAIELAAPSAQILGLEGLLDRLTRTDGGLETVDGPMRRTLEGSYALLSEAERDAFAQCAVFRGGFTFEAAETVVRAPGASTLVLIQALRDHSLLAVRAREADGATRLAMPGPVHDLAREKLRERPDASAILRRHAAHFAQIQAPARNDATRRVERDADNLFAAAEFSLTDDEGEVTHGLRSLLALESAVVPRGAAAGYFPLLDRAIAGAATSGNPEVGMLGMALRQVRARFDAPAGRTARARADLLLALDEAKRRGDLHREGLVLLDLGLVHHFEQDWAQARRHYEAAAQLLRPLDDPRALGRCLGNLGALAHDDGDLPGAAALYRQAITLLEQAGETRQCANFIANLAVLESEIGDPHVARELFRQALSVLEPLRDARLIAIALGNLGMLELELGDAARALAHHERARALLEGSEDARSRLLCLVRLAASQAALGRPALAEARLAQAERLTASAGPLSVETAALTRGFLDVAAARDATERGRPLEAASRLRDADARIARALAAGDAGGQPLIDRADDLRALLRVLRRLIAESRSPTSQA